MQPGAKGMMGSSFGFGRKQKLNKGNRKKGDSVVKRIGPGLVRGCWSE
jgi:hypothetical protein